MQPGDRRGVAALGDQVAAELGDRAEGVVVDLAAGDDRNDWVEELDEGPQEPGLGLSAKAEQDEIVPGQDGVDDLGEDGVLVADDAREEGRACLEGLDEVGPKLLPDGASAEWGVVPGAVLEVKKRMWLAHA